MDELLANLNQVSLVVLPILGVVVLIYLVMLLRKIISVFSSVETFLVDVDKKVAKLDGPLDSLTRLSRSVDLVHDATFKGVKGVVDYSIANFGAVNSWFQEVLHKEKTDVSDELKTKRDVTKKDEKGDS